MAKAILNKIAEKKSEKVDKVVIDENTDLGAVDSSEVQIVTTENETTIVGTEEEFVTDTDTDVAEGDSVEESESVEIVVVAEEVKAPVKEEKDEVTIVPVTNKPVEPKKVRVRLKQNHTTNIGGEWYYFVKGGVYPVPENVKDILTRADLLLPL